MRVPAFVGVVELTGVARGGRRVQLTGSSRGKPAAVVLSGDLLEFFELDFRSGKLVSKATASFKGLSLGGVRIERKGDELAVSVGGRELRGEGFLESLETETYFTVCSKSTCLAGVGDLVDGVLKVYEIPRKKLGVKEGAPKVHIGRGLLTVIGRETTVAVSYHGVEVVPGYFKAVASCSSGIYLLDREGFLVRLYGGILNVVGKVHPELQASCIDGGVVVADAAGVRLAVGGAFTLATRERARRISSRGDTVVVEHPEGLVRILKGGATYILASPTLRSCVAVEGGAVCATDEVALLLDPGTAQEVYANFLSTETSSSRYVELRLRPWYPGCRYVVTPRLVEVIHEVVDGGSLKLLMCPRIPGWEGFVKVDVICPTHTHSVRELVRSGKVEVREIRYKALYRAEVGRLVGTESSNCYGVLVLELESKHPIPIPLKVLVQGVEEPRIELSSVELEPGSNTVLVKFLGSCSGGSSAHVTLLGSRGEELWEILTVGYSPPEHVVVDSEVAMEPVIVENGSKSLLRAPGSYIEVVCFDGKRFGGYDDVVASDCREPAVVKVRREVRAFDRVFEVERAKVFSPSREKCFQSSGRVSAGGFYTDCSTFVVGVDPKALAKVEYSGRYVVALYLSGARVAEIPLDIPQLVAGLAISYGGVLLKLNEENLLPSALRVAHEVASSLAERVYSGSPLGVR